MNGAFLLSEWIIITFSCFFLYEGRPELIIDLLIAEFSLECPYSLPLLGMEALLSPIALVYRLSFKLYLFFVV
jgi:hypothetical protein